MKMPHRVRVALAIVAVLGATAGGAALALETYSTDASLSIGQVELNVDVGHPGALDLYVPLVDWGVRFGAVRLPARVKVELRAVDRQAAEAAAGGELPALRAVRAETTNALRSYLRTAVLVVALAALAAGLLAALALRSARSEHTGDAAQNGPAPLPRLVAVAVAGALACTVSVAVLLPPRGDLTEPEYYANGPDIPVALEAFEGLQASTRTLGDELDAQLVGLARLVRDPADRTPVADARRLVVASDLHNNVLAVPTLERVADGAIVLFAGDVTDTGAPLESALTRRIVSSGRAFVAVSGNHDSDASMRRLVREGAVVMTRRGRLLARGRYGPLVAEVGGVRVAGYDSPNERRAAENYRDRGADITEADRAGFSSWLRDIIERGRVDVVLVHEPALAADAVARLRALPRVRPPVIVTGHTHRQFVSNERGVLEVNGGTLGAGGTGNLRDADSLGLAVLRYEADPFTVQAVDSVRIDPGTGSARAERLRVG